MAARLSRRQYAEVIAFLKQTVKNPKASLRLRMSAAQRLDDIFARHQAAEERALQRAERAEVRTLAGEQGSTPVPVEADPAEETGTVDEDASSFAAYERFLPGKGAVAELSDAD